MKTPWIPGCLISLSLICASLAYRPTAEREWTSSKGTTITARAVDLTDRDMVTLETPEGREIELQLRQFSKVDQEFLVTFFRAERPDMKDDRGPDGDSSDPDLEPGTLQGPLKADDDTSYYVYIPDSYDQRVRSSVMIWTQSDGGRRETLTHLRDAADLTGMVVATPVEARHEQESTLMNNLAHANDTLRSVRSKFEINGDAVYFGGNDTGAAAALWNSMKIKSSGTFTVSGFFTPDMTGNNAGYHFMAGGATDYNRYLTAWGAAKFGDNGTHFIYPGAREFPNRDTFTTGVLWIYTQSLYEDLASRSAEAAAFEARFLPWIKNLADVSTGEALYLTDLMTNNCTLRDDFKAQIEKIHTDLGQKEEAVAHLEGRKELANFSRRQYAGYGNLFSPLKEHAPKKFLRMAEKMTGEFAKADQLERVFEQIALPTIR